MTTKQLKTIRIDGIDYFIDERLNQIREINNPHNFESVSVEVIHYWLENNITEI